MNASATTGVLVAPVPGKSVLIRFDGVSRTYRRGQVRALRAVSLDIENEEYLAITGPSGSGKSTLLYLAAGLDRPDEGSVLFDGATPKSTAEWSGLRATQIGFVFQTFQLIAGLTAAENIELPMLGVFAGENKRRSELLTCSLAWGSAAGRATALRSYPAGKRSAWPSPASWQTLLA